MIFRVVWFYRLFNAWWPFRPRCNFLLALVVRYFDGPIQQSVLIHLRSIKHSCGTSQYALLLSDLASNKGGLAVGSLRVSMVLTVWCEPPIPMVTAEHSVTVAYCMCQQGLTQQSNPVAGVFVGVSVGGWGPGTLGGIILPALNKYCYLTLSMT